MFDIDHFSESKMSASKIRDFVRMLPEPLVPKFCGIKGLSNDVLQGYRGPAHLRNGESGDSATEEEYLGIQRIGFWFGMSKTWHWIPVVGTVIFGLGRMFENVTRTSEWTYLYFDAGTGEMIDPDKAGRIQLKNKAAEEHYAKVEKLMFIGRFEEAFNEAKTALDICSDGYKHQEKFKNSMDEAKAGKAQMT